MHKFSPEMHNTVLPIRLGVVSYLENTILKCITDKILNFKLCFGIKKKFSLQINSIIRHTYLRMVSLPVVWSIFK